MSKFRKQLRAIDLYSGIGGWSLGLRLAGIEVVASYERCNAANETNFKNNHHQAQTVDIRRLELSELPESIDIVVGSPPCTQFSFSNRGGFGDVVDGMKDVYKFLTIVDHVKPTFWAMENVPRLAALLPTALKRGGALWRFRHLDIQSAIYDMAAFGLPQRRRRCIAGNFDHRLLESYSNTLPRRTLGMVVSALKKNMVSDPIFGIIKSQRLLIDHVREAELDVEELRINKAAKTAHPIYNKMSFPDVLDRSVRTITATCTRVARESIVIEEKAGSGIYRRLTIRERASLQGFPITFQFYGNSYRDKLRLIGNALPPPFAYLIACAMLKTPASELLPVSTHATKFRQPKMPAPFTQCPMPGRIYLARRTFRFALPTLRFGSGVRFELCNRDAMGNLSWGVDFYFGTSKDIHYIRPSSDMQNELLRLLPASSRLSARTQMTRLTKNLNTMDLEHMQRVWARQGPGLTRPFMLLDMLDATANSVIGAIEPSSGFSAQDYQVLGAILGEDKGEQVKNQLGRFATQVIAGLLIASCSNKAFELRLGIDPINRGESERAYI